MWSVRSTAQELSIGARAQAIHDSTIVIDTHEDTPLRFLDENYDIGSTDPNGPDFISLDKARAGNLGALFFSICVDGRTYQEGYARRAFDLIDSVYAQAARHSDRMVMAFSAEDIERAHQQHKLAALLGLEGGRPIENDLRLLRDFYRLGARYMTLTHVHTNDWADSSGDINDATVIHHNGLTDFGRQAVLEMNRVGMMVDISHVSDKTFWDVMAVSKAPIIASHSSARALRDSPRNLSDEMLRAVAKNGGVVNVAFPGNFLDDNFAAAAYSQHGRMLDAARVYNEQRKASGLAITPDDTGRFEQKWLSEHKIPRAPLKSLIDHIDHVAKIAGVEHVGLGSDFDGADFFPEGMDSAADLPKITQALLERGYSAADIRKILGGNVLRVMRDVARAGDLQQP
jgi:membrane dipeptidase